MGQEAKKSFVINTIFVITVCFLIWAGARMLLFYLMPFLIATAVAYAVQKPSEYITRRWKIKNAAAATVLTLLIYIAAIGLISLAIWFMVSGLNGAVKYLTDNAVKISSALQNLSKNITQISEKLPYEAAKAVNKSVQSITDRILTEGTVYVSKLITDIIGKIPEILLFSVITVVASCYIAKDFKKLKNFFTSVIKPDLLKKINTVKDIFQKNVFKLMGGYAVLSGITFAELLIGFLILKIPYALTAALLTSFVDILPVFGSGTVLLPWAFYCFVTGSLVRGAGLCVLYGTIVAVHYFAEPKIIGKSVGINPLISLLALFIGLRTGGFAGMILMPFAVLIVINYYRRQIEEEKSGNN